MGRSAKPAAGSINTRRKMSEGTVSFHHDGETKVTDVIKVGTRVELNSGVANQCQGQRGEVTGHRWSTCSWAVLNIVKMDDPTWNGKLGPKSGRGWSEVKTLGVGTHCCNLLDGAGTAAMFPARDILEEMKEKERTRYGKRN